MNRNEYQIHIFSCENIEHCTLPKISNSSYLAENMYHTSAKLTIGGGEQIFGVQKAPGAPKTCEGRKKPTKKPKK